MGSKPSKRSVDISGKEGEAVASCGADVVAAGGEGKVEPIADIDTLKPQLNGDTPHIEPPEKISDKEKQLENGTPENEKDSTTEKGTVVTNGDDEQKVEQENGDPKPAAETDKKNKKEKVKKKWSLRSISFSRKDKPKQEKKQKEEEKSNGEADKLTEEGTEASPTVETKSSVEPVKVEESKDEKAPETPVTEPITNGSSSPQTPPEETPVTEVSHVSEKPAEEVKPPVEPEQLPINGLSLEEKEEKQETKFETKAEEATPAPELAVSSEVCVGKSQVSNNTTPPPPLPENPPPSSLTAFAETTMARTLINAPIAPSADYIYMPIPVIALAPIPQVVESEEKDSYETIVVEKKSELVEDSHINVVTEEAENVIEQKITEIVSSPIPVETLPADNVAKDEPEKVETVSPIEEISQPLKFEIPFDDNKESVEPKPLVQIQDGDNKNEDSKAKSDLTNGDLKSMLIENAPIKNSNGEIKSEKLNGHAVESESPSESSNSIIDEVPPPPTNGVNSEQMGHDNGDESVSNEDVSESYPLPPSELCPSSEASGPPSPQPQESAPAMENSEKISVADINPEKIADLKEVANATLAAATAEAEAGAGAGGGDPSN